MLATPPSSAPIRWWILCRVIDNFGDAGVCLRLARQLAAEHAAHVTLFIDRPERLTGLVGDAPPPGPTDHVPSKPAGPGPLSVLPWPDTPDDTEHTAAPQVLLSAFGCEPPDWMRAMLAGGPRQPLWINLEYLSAEAWVDGCHGLASVKPDGAVEHYFYPGFTAGSGGLLREHDAVAGPAAGAFSARVASLAGLCGQAPHPGERVVTLFCYPGPAVDALLAAIAGGDRATLLLVPEGVAPGQPEAFAGAPLTAAGPAATVGKLRVARIPFLSQHQYDALLRLADLNFVRGEDSWVRAHWARRPFIWQPYRQAENGHHEKLEAFLGRVVASADSAGLALPAVHALAAMMRAWSGVPNEPARAAPPADTAAGTAIGAAWQQLLRHEAQLHGALHPWTESLLAQADLATQLTAFAARKL